MAENLNDTDLHVRRTADALQTGPAMAPACAEAKDLLAALNLKPVDTEALQKPRVQLIDALSS